MYYVPINGRLRTTLRDNTEQEFMDALFASERLDDLTLDNKTFRHCTFANMSFKGTSLKNCRFIDCDFVDCYFRKSSLTDSSFMSAKFIECDLPKIKIKGCDFKFARFGRCVIDFDELFHNLPREPNLREELTRSLSIAAREIGDAALARQYRLAELDAKMEHLKAAMLHRGSWYETHYTGWRRAGAAAGYVGLVIGDLVWGNGERIRPLLLCGIVSVLFFFPLLYFALPHHFWRTSGAEVGVLDCILLSIDRFFAGNGELVNVQPRSVVAAVILRSETFISVLFGGLVVSYVFKRISHQ